MEQAINVVKMDEEFRVCPSCGYRDGFHSMFKKDNDITRWLLICPSCHDIFDIGNTIGPFSDK